ncbi:MAG: SDR family NAD(P)-dependent oxidoreductase, partial [Acidobacteria bacterium ACB2]|nr:SDR family NAD(P)-dependent oxidoreductase [Acidobacteria bacterium ACB2]
VPRRVPVPVLRPPMALAKPTGVKLGPGSRVVVRGDRGGVAGVLAALLSARGVDVLPIDEDAPAAIESRARAVLAGGGVEGVFWLPALDPEPSLDSLDLAAFREANRVRVKGLYTLMRALYGAVSRPGTFLVAATRLGGLHGYGPEGATAPLGGAVTGFTKAYRRERPEALVKAVDFSMADAPQKVAQALIDEALADPGAIEIGRRNGLRFAVSFEERPAADGGHGMTLGKDSVFLVTGAAGGITSAIVADLAAASGGTFWLLDLVPEPRRDDGRIALFRRDRETLKRALIGEAKARGEKPTPVAIEKEVMVVERLDAALKAVEAVEAAGGTAVYRSANLLDGAALAAVVDEMKARHGKLDVLVHAGGIEISRNLPEKEPGEFDLVFDVKADGFFSLLSALRGVPLGATVVFSSVAGRFGNAGQTDYSAANDLLCKLTSHLGATRPGTRAIAVDWTAWGGIGMATRGSIPKIMEAAGIDMLPPEAGVPTVRRELTVGSGAREVVVAGKLGILAREWDETGGLDVAKAKAALRSRDRRLLMVGEPKGLSLHGGLSVETTLDPNEQPFLKDHAMEGTPLLPGVMGTETFAELAAFLCPGFHLASVEGLEFERPFKYFRMQPQTLHLAARAVPGEEGELVVSCVLSSVTQPMPELPPQVREHFRGRVRMSRTPAPKPSVEFTPPSRSALPVERDTVYRIYFHGPAYQVLEAVRVDGGTSVGLMADALPPNAQPPSSASLVAPRLLELCFQAAGLWEVWAMERMALPMAARSVTAYRQPEEAQGRRLYALVSAVGNGASFDARVVDEAGNVYLDLTGYRTVALPGRVTLSGE